MNKIGKRFQKALVALLAIGALCGLMACSQPTDEIPAPEAPAPEAPAPESPGESESPNESDTPDEPTKEEPNEEESTGGGAIELPEDKFH